MRPDESNPREIIQKGSISEIVAFMQDYANSQKNGRKYSEMISEAYGSFLDETGGKKTKGGSRIEAKFKEMMLGILRDIEGDLESENNEETKYSSIGFEEESTYSQKNTSEEDLSEASVKEEVTAESESQESDSQEDSKEKDSTPLKIEYYDSFVANANPPSTSGEDQLDIMPDVRAFAKLISSRVLSPPLSIGLFGDWGSGKSFFMEKLDEEVSNNAHISQQAIVGERNRVEELVKEATKKKDEASKTRLKEELEKLCPDAKSQANQIKNWIAHKDSWGTTELKKIYSGSEVERAAWIKRLHFRFQGIFEPDISSDELEKIREKIKKDVVERRDIIKLAEEELIDELEIYREANIQNLVHQLVERREGADGEKESSYDEAMNTVLSYAESHGRGLSPFHPNVAQIKFNAWHYIDTNLWASMMVRVFEALNRFVGNLSKDEKEKINLYRSLALTNQLTEEKENEIKEIENKIEKIQKSLEALEEERADKRKDFYKKANSKEIWAGVWEIIAEKEYYQTFHLHIKETLLNSGSEIGLDISSEIELVEKRLMGKELYEKINRNKTDDAENNQEQERPLESQIPPELVKLNIARHKAAIDGLIKEMQATRGKASSYWTYMKGLRGRKRFYFLLLFVIGVIGACFTPELIQISFPDVYKEIGSTVIAWFSAGVPILYKLIETFNKSLGKANQVFGFFEAAREDLNELKNRATKELDEEIADQNKKIAEARETEISLNNELDELKKQQSSLEESLTQMESGEQLAEYLEKRLEEADYKKHLGLISTVREDLEKLTHYLHQRGNHSRIVLQMTENPTKDDADLLGIQKVHTIDRIILYIDDLDRCPPEKVIDVLQAIHLLLAFPLFVVVVGVDVRWISRSLLRKYGGMLGARQEVGLSTSELLKNGSPDREEPKTSKETDTTSQLSVQTPFSFDREASPYDYLEKIFQIPFRLKSMENLEKLQYVMHLIADDKEEEAKKQKAEETKTIELEDDKTFESDIAERGIPQLKGDKSVEKGEASEEFTQTEVEHSDSEKTIVVDTARTQNAAKEEEEIRSFRYRPSYFKESERLLLEVLSSILNGKPRTVKRFINICRLIKSHEIHGTGKDEGGDRLSKFDKITFALAIVTGLPEFARYWLQWIEMSKAYSTKIYSEALDEETSDEEAQPEKKLLIDFIAERHEEILNEPTITNRRILLDELKQMGLFLKPPKMKLEVKDSKAEEIEKVGKETQDFLEKLGQCDVESFQKYLEIASRYSFRFSRY